MVYTKKEIIKLAKEKIDIGVPFEVYYSPEFDNSVSIVMGDDKYIKISIWDYQLKDLSKYSLNELLRNKTRKIYEILNLALEDK